MRSFIDDKGRLRRFLGIVDGRAYFRVEIASSRLLPVPAIRETGGADEAVIYGSTNDGIISVEASGTFSTLHAQSSGTLSTSSTQLRAACYVADDEPPVVYSIARSVVFFDTSGLAGMVLENATLSLYGDSKVYTDTLHAVSYSSSRPPTASSYDRTNWGTTSLGSISSAAWANGAYNNIALSIGVINAGGWTAVGLRTAADIAVSSAGGAFVFASADYAATTRDPKLTVTYSLPMPITVSAPLPADGAKLASTSVTLSALYAHTGSTAGLLRFQADTVATFDSGNLVADTVNVNSGNRGQVNLTLAGRGTWYWRVRGEQGEWISDWVTGQTVVRVSCMAVVVSPADDHDVTATPQVFQVLAESDDDEQLAARVQIDTAGSFESANLVELVSEKDDSGETHALTQAMLGSTTWYWRARAEREDEAVSDWTGIRTLNVDTGGALPISILPNPESTLVLDPATFLVEWSALLDHALTPTAAKTLRLQVQRDTTDEFHAPVTEISSRVLGGQRATVPMSITIPGAHWLRFRTLADYGEASDWDVYEVTFTLATVFTRESSWQPQVGPRPNRVFVRIGGGTVVKTAQVPDVPAAAKVDHWLEVPEGTSESEAQATADSVLAVMQARPITVSGPIALSVAAAFGRRVVVQWWEREDGEPVMREQHELVLAKKVHNIDTGETTLHLGDYTPPPEETIARILAKLSRP